MNSIKFLGIYSGNLPNAAEDLLSSPSGQYWYAWYDQTEQKYLVQTVESKKNPNRQAYIINPAQFNLNFVDENIKLPQEPNLPNHKDLLDFDEQVNSGKNVSIPKNEQTNQGQKQEKIESSSENNELLIVRGQKEKSKSTIIKASQEAEQAKPKENLQKKIQISAPEQGIDDEPSDLLGLSHQDDEIPVEKLNLLSPEEAKKLQRLNREATTLDFTLKQDFNHAMSLWYKGRKSIAKGKFEELLSPNGRLVAAHKHTFTNFAIQLRKLHQNDLAVQFALRCVDLSQGDSHAHFNVGRLYFELRRYDDAAIYLKKALNLEPELKVAAKLLNIVTHLIERHRKKYEAYI